MAKKKVFLLTATVLMMTGCGFMQNTSSSNAAPTTQATTPAAQTAAPAVQTNTNATVAGQNAGSALQALYAQYKTDGKYELMNMQNALNTMTLIANCEGLKQNYKDKNYLTDFGKGLIAGSLGLITQNNVQTVTSSLLNMVTSNETVQAGKSQIQNGANTAAGYASTAAQYAGSLSTLLSAFGQ